YLNPIAEALTGCKDNEALGRALDQILALVSGEGETVPIKGSANAISGNKRERHLTEEEEIRRLNADLERRVAERTEALEVANKELEAFSYSVAHDLRAPLRGIEGFSQALIENHVANLGPEGVDHLHRIRASTKRMGQLIDDLL